MLKLKKWVNKKIKGVLSAIREMGITFHATGANFWLGFLPFFFAIITRQPKNILEATVVGFAIWIILCLAALIPPKLIALEKPIPQEFIEMEEKIAVLKRQLLNQYCYHIKNLLTIKCIANEGWEYISLDPLSLFMSGKTVRIKIENSNTYCAADVKVLKDGSLEMNPIQVAVVETSQDVMQAVNTLTDVDTTVILQKWLANNLENIENIAYEKKSKGYLSFCVYADTLPEKTLWKKLSELLVSEGFKSAKITESGINLEILGKAA